MHMNPNLKPLISLRDILADYHNLSDVEQEELLDSLDTVIRNYSGEKGSTKEDLPHMSDNAFLQLGNIRKYAGYIGRQMITKTRLANIQNGLLILIGNLKHYLGDSWRTIFPNGMEGADAFLEEIDKNNILQTDTWSRYEKQHVQDEPEQKEEPFSLFNASGTDDEMFWPNR